MRLKQWLAVLTFSTMMLGGTAYGQTFRGPVQGQAQGQGQFQGQDQSNSQSTDLTGNGIVTDNSSSLTAPDPLNFVFAGQCDRPAFGIGVQSFADNYGPVAMLTFPLGPNTCVETDRLNNEAQLASYCLQLDGQVDFAMLGGGLERCPTILGIDVEAFIDM